MKKWIPVLAILLVVVFAAGCTSESKTYSGNGVTFQYPAEWSNDYKSDFQSSFGNTGNVLVSLGKDDAGIVVVNFDLGTAKVSASEFASAFKSSVTSGSFQFVSEKTVQIAGVTGYEQTYKYTENSTQMYLSVTFFEKNNTMYLLMIGTPDNSQETNDMILNSFKFT